MGVAKVGKNEERKVYTAFMVGGFGCWYMGVVGSYSDIDLYSPDISRNIHAPGMLRLDSGESFGGTFDVHSRGNSLGRLEKFREIAVQHYGYDPFWEYSTRVGEAEVEGNKFKIFFSSLVLLFSYVPRPQIETKLDRSEFLRIWNRAKGIYEKLNEKEKKIATDIVCFMAVEAGIELKEKSFNEYMQVVDEMNREHNRRYDYGVPLEAIFI